MNSAAERGYFAARRNQSSGTGVSPVSFRFWRDGILLEHTGETPVPLPGGHPGGEREKNSRLAQCRCWYNLGPEA